MSCRSKRFPWGLVLMTGVLSLPAPAAPSAAQAPVAFKETLSLTRDDWFPYQIMVDDRGHIFVLSGRERTLLEFDSAGRELSQRQFPKGQGPGEFDSFDPILSADGRMVAADFAQRRLTFFGPDFKVVQIEKMKLYGGHFRMDSQGQRYFLAYQASRTRGRNRVVLTKCAPSGEILKEIAWYDWGPREIGKGLYEDDLFRTHIKFALDPRDNLIYAFSNAYEVFVVSPGGDPIRTISRNIHPRKVEKADTDRLLPDPAKPSPYKYLVPERVPAIAGLFPLKDGQLLVVTFEKTGDESSLAADVFGGDGRFLATVRIPRYFHWDFLLAPAKSAAVFADDELYTIESDADEEKFWVKRYQLEWR